MKNANKERMQFWIGFILSPREKNLGEREMQVVVLFPCSLCFELQPQAIPSRTLQFSTHIHLLQRAPHASTFSPMPLYLIPIKI